MLHEGHKDDFVRKDSLEVIHSDPGFQILYEGMVQLMKIRVQDCILCMMTWKRSTRGWKGGRSSWRYESRMKAQNHMAIRRSLIPTETRQSTKQHLASLALAVIIGKDFDWSKLLFKEIKALLIKRTQSHWEDLLCQSWKIQAPPASKAAGWTDALPPTSVTKTSLSTCFWRPLYVVRNRTRSLVLLDLMVTESATFRLKIVLK